MELSKVPSKTLEQNHSAGKLTNYFKTSDIGKIALSTNLPARVE
jgi:hypothetical protein